MSKKQPRPKNNIPSENIRLCDTEQDAIEFFRAKIANKNTRRSSMKSLAYHTSYVLDKLHKDWMALRCDLNVLISMISTPKIRGDK